MTAQANIILKNLLMPGETEPQGGEKDSDVPKLLGRPIGTLNMIYLCSLGRMMAMMSEKNQNIGILGK